jgi:hypothetical protein
MGRSWLLAVEGPPAPRHLLPLAADFLGTASDLGSKERSSVDGYLEAISDALAYHAQKP